MTEAPGFSSALLAASARLAEAGRKLRRDPRIREVFEGIDLEEGPDGTTISSHLDVLPVYGPTVSWLLDGTLGAHHWNLDGSIRRDPDGNGQRVVTRFAVRAGDEPQAFPSALRSATGALIRSAKAFDVVTGAGPRTGTRGAPNNRARRPASPPATSAGLQPSASGPEPVRSHRGGSRNARATKRTGTVDAGMVGNARSRQRTATIIGDPDVGKNSVQADEVHRRQGRRSYTVTFAQVKIVQAVDLEGALARVQLPADAEVLSVIELV